MASTTAPVETKTAASASVGVVIGAITWALVSYVPAFHAGLPPQLATFLAWIVPVVLGAAASWLAKHTTRPDEVMAQALQLLADAGVTLPKT